MRIKIYLSAFALVIWMFLVTSIAQAAITISINPKSTFLRTNNDPGALNAVPIVLSDQGIRGGDLIMVEALGDFAFGEGINFPEDGTGMIGVFSASAVLLSSSALNRVQDAIDAGIDFITSPTCDGQLPTDIPEDFFISSKLMIKVPLLATHLFVAPADCFYGDNNDPDGDYAVRITNLSHPISLTTVPPSGILMSTAGFDLALIVEGSEASVIGGTATLDGTNVTGALAACIRAIGTLSPPLEGQTLRCPGLTGGTLGSGLHTLEVCLNLSDGSQVCDTRKWEVLGNTEP